MYVHLHHPRATRALRLPGGREWRGLCGLGSPSQLVPSLEMQANNAGNAGVDTVFDRADFKPVTPPGGA